MPDAGRKRLQRTTFIFWILFGYVVAALVWWYISLEKQNRQIENARMETLRLQKERISSAQHTIILASIQNETKRNTAKYIAEGITFFIFILLGAALVYRSIRKHFIAQLQQRNFMMAVTHELKTPIAVARLNLETILKYSLDPEKQKKLIKTTLDETARLNTLTNNILLSSQLEGGGYVSAKDDLDLSALLKDCIYNFSNRYPDRVFHQEIEEDTDIKGDPLLLQILVNNLIENAIKYSPKETPVTIILKKVGSGAVFHVIDEGPGIPESEKKKIFSKFYRVGNEATRKTKGTGLGLYLCRKIAGDHNADISVTNHLPHGCNFAVSFYSKY